MQETRYRTAIRCAVVALAFSVAVAAVLIRDFAARGAKHPFEEKAYLALKAVSVDQPGNERVKAELRALDLEIREKYFRHQRFTAIGAGLLALGVGWFLVLAKAAAAARRELPHPGALPANQDREARLKAAARLAIGVLIAAFLALGVGLAVHSSTYLPKTADELAALVASSEKTPSDPKDAPTEPDQSPVANTPEKNPSDKGSMPNAAPQETPKNPDEAPAAAVSETLPTDEEIAKSWPFFRGPGGTGVSAYDNIPVRWDAASGEGIAWKTEVALPGNNSPVVWGDRVFVSGADVKNREVYCFDAAKGALLWRQEVPGTPASTAKPLKVNEDTGYAAPTTACDGRRVYAIFANGDLGAFTLDGKLAWAKSLGVPENAYGHASSLLTWKHLLIVQLDQGQAKDKKSRLLAFESATGKPAWETVREVPNSWASPILIRAADRDQIVTAADPWCAAYDPADGKEIWRFKCLRQDVGPSPTFADGVVFAVNTSPQLTAIRSDGQGDVTKTHGIWMGEDNLPDTCSPLATKDNVFLLGAGMLTCYDAKQGDNLWELEIEGQFDASPAMAGGKIYVIDKETGKCSIVEPGKTAGKVVGESELGEGCVSSPAFQDGRLYLRGKKHLFCIGKPQ